MGTDKTINNSQRSSDDRLWWLFCVLSMPMCIPITISYSPEPTTPEANSSNQTEPSPTNLPMIPIAAGLCGSMLLLLVTVLLLATVLICKRRKRNHQQNRYDTLIQSHLNEVFDSVYITFANIIQQSLCYHNGWGKWDGQAVLQAWILNLSIFLRAELLISLCCSPRTQLGIIITIGHV